MMIDEMIYCLVACTLTIQFKNIFTKYFNFPQSSAMIHNVCEIVIYDVRTMLNLHSNCVVL